MAEPAGRFGTLRFLSPEGRERVRLLGQPTNRLGRGEANDIVLDDESIALRHARLTIEGGRLIVEDLGSGTGTFLDGRLIPPGSPTLVEPEQEIRFGAVSMRFEAPAPDAAAAAAASAAGGRPESPPSLEPTIRVSLTPPSAPLVAGGPNVLAHLVVTNTGQVVDQISVSVLDVPPDWVRINNPKLVLVPGETAEVTIAMQVPRRHEAHAGIYEFSVMVSSSETGREAFASGSVELKPHYETITNLRPRRSTKKFELRVENHGNAPVAFAVAGRDDDDKLQFAFETPSIEVDPGETGRLPFEALGPRRWFGKRQQHAFEIKLTSTSDSTMTSQAMGELISTPPLQRFVVPSILACAIIAGVLGALLFFLWPFGDDDATAQDFLSDVHPMCDPDADPDDQPEQTVRTGGEPSTGGGAGGPTLFAQNDPDWGTDEYARAQDPDFGPDWCGDTIAQCGCAMTSMANVMSVLALATMPDGAELTPDALNSYLNRDAVRDSRGWVSRGYAYGNVLWTAANQLSGEMAREFGTPTIRFNGWGPGDDAFIRSELEAGRPVVLEIPGHFIAAYGIDEETDRILIYDPYYPDRTTIDWYHERGIPIRGSRLFEPSDDLSGVMITTPRDVRIKVTRKDTGEEVGTLSDLPADEAATRARKEIEGGDYLTSPAWRDPTCTEKAPPLEAGVNQIWLPGSIDDYVIEYLNTSDEVPAIAIHSYDEDGRLELLHDEAPASGQVQSFDADPEITPTPEPTEPPDDETETPATPVTPDDPANPPGQPGGGGGTTNPPPTDTDDDDGDTGQPPQPPGEPPGEPGDDDDGVTAASSPKPVTVTCKTSYQDNPKLATVNCIGQVGGSFTSVRWSVNGTPAASTTLAFTTTFTANTSLTVTFTACNLTDCENASQAVIVAFPTAPPQQPPTNGGGGNNGGTPPQAPVQAPSTAPSCSVSYVVDNYAMIACLVSIQGQYTSVYWSSAGTTNPAQTGLQTTYTTSLPNNGRLAIFQRVTNRVCNGTACTEVNIDLDIRPRYSTVTDWESPFFSTFDRAWRIYVLDDGEVVDSRSCIDPGTEYRLEVEAFVSDQSLPSQVRDNILIGLVQFSANSSPLGAPVPVTFDFSEGISYSWLTDFVAPSAPLVVSATYLGTTNLEPSSAPPVVLPRCLNTPVLQKPDNGSVFEFGEVPTVELSWNGVAGATSYEIAIRSVGGPSFFIEQTLAGTDYTFDPPQPGTYLWRVRARDDSVPALSDWSGERSVRFSAPTIEIEFFDASWIEGCPGGFSLECVELSWEVLPNGDPGVTIEITRDNSIILQTTDLVVSSYIDDGLDPDNVCYEYELTATNSDGVSVNSFEFVGVCLE